MDALELIASLLMRRDYLESSLPYASPEEAVAIERGMVRIMRRVVYLMGRVQWIEGGK
jgi:hypothetical protein